LDGEVDLYEDWDADGEDGEVAGDAEGALDYFEELIVGALGWE
jgi:hypothetical protein